MPRPARREQRRRVANLVPNLVDCISLNPGFPVPARLPRPTVGSFHLPLSQPTGIQFSFRASRSPCYLLSHRWFSRIRCPAQRDSSSVSIRVHPRFSRSLRSLLRSLRSFVAIKMRSIYPSVIPSQTKLTFSPLRADSQEASIIFMA